MACPTSTVCETAAYDSSTSQAVALRSTDAGASWSIQQLPSANDFLRGISCPSASTCEASGNPSADGYFVRTTNGGATWTAQTAPANDGIESVDCPTAAICYSIAEINYITVILRSSDGGASWTTQNLPIRSTLASMSCASVSTCEVVGLPLNTTSAVGAAFGTTDGGTTWMQQTLPTSTGELDYVACPSTKFCEAMQGGSPTSAIETNDGGSTWTTQALPSGVLTVLGLACPTSGGCFATAEGPGPGYPSLMLAYGSPLTITTGALAEPTVGRAYSTKFAAEGGTAPYTWLVKRGSLPPGLSLGTGGALRGTPTTAGTYGFSIEALDSSHPKQHAVDHYSLTVK